MFKVIIAGSRYFTSYQHLKEACEFYLSNKLPQVTIISGHAKGADSLGEKWASEMNLPCEIYPADWNKYGKSAGYIRNKQMAEVGNALIAFKIKGIESKGTDNMISLAREKGISVRVLIIEQ